MAHLQFPSVRSTFVVILTFFFVSSVVYADFVEPTNPKRMRWRLIGKDVCFGHQWPHPNHSDVIIFTSMPRAVNVQDSRWINGLRFEWINGSVVCQPGEPPSRWCSHPEFPGAVSVHVMEPANRVFEFFPIGAVGGRARTFGLSQIAPDGRKLPPGWYYLEGHDPNSTNLTFIQDPIGMTKETQPYVVVNRDAAERSANRSMLASLPFFKQGPRKLELDLIDSTRSGYVCVNVYASAAFIRAHYHTPWRTRIARWIQDTTDAAADWPVVGPVVVWALDNRGSLPLRRVGELGVIFVFIIIIALMFKGVSHKKTD